MKNYLFFVGTVAEYIKILPVMVEMEKRGVRYKIVSTGQNNLTKLDLFEKLKHKNLDIILNRQPSKQTTISLMIWWFSTLIKGILIFRKENTKNTYLIIHGDTISTFLGAILGKMFSFKIIHIESGLRSFNYLSPFPEEINRVLVSNLADVHFAQNDWALNNLKNKSGIKKNTKYNTLIDSLRLALEKKEIANIKLPAKFFVFIFHRQENLANQNHVKKIIDLVLKKSKEIHCLFVVHGNTKETLKSLSLYERVSQSKNITLVDRIPYFTFMNILNKAEFLITDGGSNQEEAYYLGLPIFILRDHTERTEGLNNNAVLGGKDFNSLSNFFAEYRKYRKPTNLTGESPSKIIVDFLENQ